MPFTVPAFEDIRGRYLQAVRNVMPQAAIGPDSDHWIRATAIAAVVEDLFAHQLWIMRQMFPDTADVDRMEKMANQRGLVRKPAAAASGTLQFAGSVGAVVPSGTQVFDAQGNRFASTVTATIGAGGTATATALAVTAGAAGNVAANTAATVDTPPTGITGATIVAMSGGADVESDASLLQRLLLRMASPPQGGAKTDYLQWALAFPGVARAYVYDLRRGIGTVDVVPFPATGLPSAQLISDLYNYINPLRPLGLGMTGFQVIMPTAVNVAVAATLTLASGYTIAGLTSAITAAVNAEFTSLAPGDTVYRSQLIGAITNVKGVLDANLTSPAANVPTVVDASNMQVGVLNGITLS
jgi:uncharacterized phage protein gp47/JayE